MTVDMRVVVDGRVGCSSRGILPFHHRVQSSVDANNDNGEVLELNKRPLDVVESWHCRGRGARAVVLDRPTQANLDMDAELPVWADAPEVPYLARDVVRTMWGLQFLAPIASMSASRRHHFRSCHSIDACRLLAVTGG